MASFRIHLCPARRRPRFSSAAPGRHLGRGRRGRASGGDEGSPPPAGKSPSAAPLPSSSPKREEQSEGRGPWGRGRGSPLPSPMER